ncbi:MAG: ABC transporter ATP-binding protein, partial [Acaryochloris sp. SU_5_25]|nr:ABC transporter ATP-binding protein [Acaryochloris sp. SU_5_25]NJK54099.1 ABC transporter ATP-binding protein [Leptolyngbyaceae cyanobacterium SU_3_3]
DELEVSENPYLQQFMSGSVQGPMDLVGHYL